MFTNNSYNISQYDILIYLIIFFDKLLMILFLIFQSFFQTIFSKKPINYYHKIAITARAVGADLWLGRASVAISGLFLQQQ